MPSECAWTELGGSGPRLIFTHANGFPPDSYRTLLEMLTPYFRVATSANRPMWSEEDPRRLRSWHPMAGDLGTMIGQRAGEPVVAVGHSLGGLLCALAAARNPELFAALVLLDPVVFTGVHAVAWSSTKRLGMARRFPLVRGAERRLRRGARPPMTAWVAAAGAVTATATAAAEESAAETKAADVYGCHRSPCLAHRDLNPISWLHAIHSP